MEPGSGITPPEITGLISGKPAEIIAGYNALRSFEADCDKAQGLLRTIASAWLISAIGAIAYLVLQQINHAPGPSANLDAVSGATLRQIIMLFVTIGMCSLWRLDQKVYQNLLHSIFSLGYWIEYKCPSVPPARMTLFHTNDDITKDLGGFYSHPVTLIWWCALANIAGSIYDVNDLFMQISRLQSLNSHIDLKTNNVGSWIIAFVIFLTHSIYLRMFCVDARSWGKLREYLPPQAIDAKEARSPSAPARAARTE